MVVVVPVIGRGKVVVVVVVLGGGCISGCVDGLGCRCTGIISNIRYCTPL